MIKLVNYIQLCTLTLFIVFTFRSTLQAQELPVFAALYNNLDGNVTLVAADGTVLQAFTLPRAEGTTYAQNLAVSPDGETFAYVTYGEPSILHVLSQGTDLQVTLPPDTAANSLDFIASPAVYTPDGSMMAFGYAQSSGNWQIQLINIADGAVAAAINQTTPIPNITPLESVGRTPIIQRVDENGRVIFALAEPFSGYQTNFQDTYIWEPATGAITSAGIPTAVDGDTLNNEQLTLLFDPAYPNAADAFPYPQANALYITQADGTRRLLFTTANVSLFWARFVSGGQYVLVGSFSPENRIAWLLLNRDGSVLGNFPSLQMTGVVGTPDGFVYTVDAGVNSGTILYRVGVDGIGASDPIELWSGPEGASYRVVWAR